MPELLEARNVVAGYGRGPDILQGASLTVRKGQSQCIIGPNGAGKSTLLKAIAGLLPIRKGEILFKGERIDGLRPDQILRKGICFVPQERALFPKMTVRENLRMGGYILSDRAELEERTEEVLKQFPILRERAHQHAGTLSGGEQQMLSMART
ncbi:MAG: ATP-binding cassette domain-containing protein, partial [Anaerocolumna sp.]